MIKWKTHNGIECSIEEIADFKAQKIYMDVSMIKPDGEEWRIQYPKDEFERMFKMVHGTMPDFRWKK